MKNMDIFDAIWSEDQFKLLQGGSAEDGLNRSLSEMLDVELQTAENHTTRPDLVRSPL